MNMEWSYGTYNIAISYSYIVISTITPFHIHLSYPLVMTNSLLLKMAIEIVDFPSYKMVDLSIATLNYQRVW